VAVHAELIAGDYVFVRMGVVAVDTTDTGVLHPAGHEGGEFIVLIPDLAVGVEGV
jgi:hypothetical protein